MRTRFGVFLLIGTVATSAEAAITFNFGGNSSLSEQGNGLAVLHDDSAYITAFGSASLNGSFDVFSDTYLTDIQISPNNASAFDGATISFTTTLSTVGLIYNESVIGTEDGPGLPEGSLYDLAPQNLNHYVVNYSAVLSGYSVSSLALLGDVNFLFHDSNSFPPPPVPEPASLGAIGLGLAGLVGSRRKRSK